MLDNKDARLKPNMLTSLRIRDYLNDNALVVPSIILKKDFNGTFLFLARQNESGIIAVKQYVTPGLTVQDMTMVEGGLTVGEQVITQGYNLVTDGTEVRVINP
jgi:hypothetical protein